MSTSLVHDFDWIARQMPGAPALSWHGGVWTYADLQRAKVPAARDNMAFVGILSTQLWHAQFVAGQTFD